MSQQPKVVELSKKSDNALHIDPTRVLNEAIRIVDECKDTEAPVNKVFVLLVCDQGGDMGFEIRRLQGGMNSKETHFWMDMSKKLNLDLYLDNGQMAGGK